MIERTYLVRVDIDARLGIGHDRVVIPAIPEAPHDRDEFLGNLVALGMIGMRFGEIGGCDGVRCRDGIPGGTPAAQVIERGKARATVNGSLYVVEAVAPSPICFVAPATAASNVRGSSRTV